MIGTLLAAGGVFLAAYACHEVVHILPLAVGGVEYDVSLFPGERPAWQTLFVGALVQIEVSEEVAPLAMLSSALAPLVLTIPALVLWAQLLFAAATPLSSFLLVGAWLLAAFPSPRDWYTAYQQYQRLTT